MADAGPIGGQQQQQPQQRGPSERRGANNNTDPLLNVRDRLFHTLFYRLTLTYARASPKPLRRAIEAVVLVQAALCFLTLVYVHVTYSRYPVQCLESQRETWPREGILRVEVLAGGAPEGYDVEASYEKERALHVRARRESQAELAFLTSPFSTQGILDDYLNGGQQNEGEAHVDEDDEAAYDLLLASVDEEGRKDSNGSSSITLSFNQSFVDHTETETSLEEALENATATLASEEQVEDEFLADEESYHHLYRGISVDMEYIVEYSLEYGFLRLSPAARQRLNITVQLVVLDPHVDQCFGDALSQVRWRRACACLIPANFLHFVGPPSQRVGLRRRPDVLCQELGRE